MPADSKRGNWMSAMVRLLGAVRLWRTPRRRAGLHDLMHMSDRMLADIGVRRADVHAAMSGLMPAQNIARTRGGAPWTAQVHRLRPRCHEPSEACAARKDLSAAA
jgi:uncharacterized protein YjiS (DUF1127 family)